MYTGRPRQLRLVRSLCARAGVLVAAALAACSDGAVREDDPNDPAGRIRALLEGSEAPVLAVQGDTIHVGERARAFYADRGFAPAWTSREGFLAQGETLAAAFRGASRDGLEPALYHEGAVQALIARARRDSEEGFPVGDLLGTLDILLSEAFLRYATDLVSGTVDPDSVGLPWQIPRQDSTDARMLEQLLTRPDLAQALEELRPAVPYYDHLRDALPRYRKLVEGGGWPAVTEGEPLELGASSPRVLEVRRRLVAEEDPVETSLVVKAPEPEVYDAALAQAVTRFQERHGIEPDGRVGAETLEAMNVPAEERLLQVLLNLDRWRWLPRELGERYVLVNVPGFELAVMENHAPVLRMNVVVGKDGWRTPFFQDSLEFIVVNPYWNVPPSIVRRDLVPAVERDPGYLARNGYEVLNRSGGRVDPYAVNVSTDAYTIRQRPGSNNALGEVKFVFPNAMNIYLHDTPAKHLFERSRRAFSSGCIRVEKPRELAEYLLRTATTTPPGMYERLRETGREQWVELDEKLPIYILYFTAWADEQGSVRFYQDVYRKDSAINGLARAKLGPPSPGVVTGELVENQQSSLR